MAEVGRFGLGTTVLRAGLSLLLAVVLLAPQALWAQSSALQFDDKASPLRCLQPAEAELPPIVYPADALALKQGGIVRVWVTFKDATSAPEVEVFHTSGPSEFVGLVRQRVAAYRLPCLKAGQGPVVATQEFQFTPGDGRKVVWSMARDLDHERRIGACFERDPDALKKMTYPSRAANAGSSGVVIARMTFSVPNGPPEVEILTDAGSRVLAGAVKQFAQGYRIPCVSAEELPLAGVQVFKFVHSDVQERVLKDVGLSQFLGAVDGIEKQRLRFDFNTMGCPFDVKLQLYQPYAKNPVGEVGQSDPNRFEFIEWLKNVSLALPKDALKQVLGDTMTISVPCGVLSLP